jgi:hypothetical protein
VIFLCSCRLLSWQLSFAGILKVRIMDDMFVGWECEDCGGPCEEGMIYCEDCSWLMDMSDDDGQPDEAQEWYDYDCDC